MMMSFWHTSRRTRSTMAGSAAGKIRFFWLAISIVAILYLIDFVGADSLSLGVQVSISIASIGVTYSAFLYADNQLLGNRARTDFIGALLDLQLASMTVASNNQFPEHSLPGLQSMDFDPLFDLVENNLLSKTEARLIQFWSQQILSGRRIPSDSLQEVREFAQYLASRVSQVTSLPPPPPCVQKNHDDSTATDRG